MDPTGYNIVMIYWNMFTWDGSFTFYYKIYCSIQVCKISGMEQNTKIIENHLYLDFTICSAK